MLHSVNNFTHNSVANNPNTITINDSSLKTLKNHYSFATNLLALLYKKALYMCLLANLLGDSAFTILT